jgi:hypothetical protein
VVLFLPLWVVLFALLVGWGLLVLWLFDRASAGAVRGGLTTFQTMWLGYAGLIAFLVAISLVLPIARPALGFACVPAAAGFALQRHAVARRIRALARRPRTCAVVAGVVFVAWFVAAYAASDRVTAYDTNLYHLQVVKWATRYPAVPGLANLHLRFGYDNSVHLFGALVDAFWQGTAVHTADGFLIAAALGHWFVEIFTARTPRGRLRQAYCLLTLPFLLAKLWQGEVASYSADLPLAILALVLVLELVSLPRGTIARLRVPLAAILMLGAVVFTTKLGGLPMFAIAAAMAAALAWRRMDRRTALVVFGFPVVLVIGWLVRNAILSGWLIFPVFGRLPLPWAVPADAAADHLRWIESWARLPQQMPDQVLDHGFLHWFLPWFGGFRQTHEMILLAASAALLAWRVGGGAGRSAARRAGELAAIGACLLALAQWFVGAPDLRFGGFLFWVLPAALFATMVAGAMREPVVRGFVLALSLVLCAWSGGLTPRLDEIVPKPWGRPVAPARRPTRWLEAGPGTWLATPQTGDQCGDEELPCTPNPGTQVLRHPDSLGGGFYPGPRL